MKMLFAAPDYSFPGQLDFDAILLTSMRARAYRLETRITRFLVRTGLDIKECTLVALSSGESYPQWSGAIALLAKF